MNIDADFCRRGGEALRPLPPPPRQKGEKIRVFARMGKRGKIYGKNAKKLLTKTTCLRIIVHVAERCGTQEMRKRDEAVRGA